MLTPLARYADDVDNGGNRETPRLMLTLVREAGVHLQCVLGQYRGLAARAERCLSTACARRSSGRARRVVYLRIPTVSTRVPD